jgi:hypothetical protein
MSDMMRNSGDSSKRLTILTEQLQDRNRFVLPPFVCNGLVQKPHELWVIVSYLCALKIKRCK